MRVSELGRIHKAHGLAHWAIYLLLLHKLERLLQSLLHVFALLAACPLLAFTRFSCQAIIQARPSDVCESLDARIVKCFSTLLCADQVLAYLLLREVRQFQ